MVWLHSLSLDEGHMSIKTVNFKHSFWSFCSPSEKTSELNKDCARTASVLWKLKHLLVFDILY